jgi:hypothetical protein
MRYFLDGLVVKFMIVKKGLSFNIVSYFHESLVFWWTTPPDIGRMMIQFQGGRTCESQNEHVLQ